MRGPSAFAMRGPSAFLHKNSNTFPRTPKCSHASARMHTNPPLPSHYPLAACIQHDIYIHTYARAHTRTDAHAHARTRTSPPTHLPPSLSDLRAPLHSACSRCPASPLRPHLPALLRTP
eukprot:6200761-Pleurochrysis_carterae.AAC.1